MSKHKYSTKRIAAIKTTATASQYIDHIDDLTPGSVVLLLRVSRDHQKDHLDDQETHLTQEMTRRNRKVIAVLREIASGWAENRVKLEQAAMIAREAGAVLVAESGCRFVRGYRLPGEKRDVLPSVMEMERLMCLVDGAKLATLLRPDTHWTAVRSEQTKRGQQASGNHGGRQSNREPGWKKARRRLKMSEALKLREVRKGYREIGRAVDVPWSTVRDWIKRGERH